MSGIRYRLFYIAVLVFITGVASAQNDPAAVIKKLRDSLSTSSALNKKLQLTLDSTVKQTPCVACVKDITNFT